MSPSRRWLLALLVVLALPACKKKDDSKRGSGVGGKIVRVLPLFTKLRVGGSVRAEVEVGKTAPFELRGDDNLLSHVLTRVEGSTLVIEPDGILKPTQPLVARFAVSALDGVELTVAASAIVTGVRAERFEVRGAGGTRLTLKGSSKRLDVTVKSAARFDLEEFSAATASVHAADGARVELGYLEELDVTLTGASQVVYRGQPVIKRTVLPPARLMRAP